MSRYDSMSRMNQLYKELDRLFDARLGSDGGEDSSRVATCDWVPPVDIKEEADRFVILADLPGMDPKDIDITMEAGMLTIRGERPGAEQDAAAFKRSERPRGTFYRRFGLPDTADAEKISARGHNGVLELIIPKHQRVQPRRINVES